MDLFRAVDAYCERTDPTLWSEPVNALTNAAFLIAAAVMWRRTAGMPAGRALSALVFAIGLGSFAFHTVATGWAELLDVIPIAVFILAYVFVSNRDFWGLAPWTAAAATALFVPYALLAGAVFARLPFFHISAAYWPVPLLIGIYAFLLRRRDPATARGLALGGALLVVSLLLRSVDSPLCTALPLGTHWLWHCLNGVMLGWMTEVWRRARTA